MSDEDDDDLDETKRRFAAVVREYGEFDRIHPDDRLHPNRHLCGMLKVASLLRDPTRFNITTNGDILYLPVPTEMTDADIRYLVLCGVGYDDGFERLRMFV